MNEWIPVRFAVEDGTQCELMCGDRYGAYEVPGPFVLHEGVWYLIDPPREVTVKVVAFRPCVNL